MKTFTIKGEEDTPKYTILVFGGTSERSLTNFPDIISVFSPNSEANNILEYYTNGQPTETQFFSTLKPGKGYCIQANRTFTIETDESALDSIPDNITLISKPNGPSWHIIKFPFSTPVKISDYPFIKKVQRESIKTNSSTLEEYNSEQPLSQQPFNTLDPETNYIVHISSTGVIKNPISTPKYLSTVTPQQLQANTMLQCNNIRPIEPWVSPKINIWIDSELDSLYPMLKKAFNKVSNNILFSSLLPSYGNSFDVLSKKINVYKAPNKRILTQLSYDSDGRSKIINLCFYNQIEAVYYFKETPSTPTFSFYEDVCIAKTLNNERIYGVGFNLADLNAELTSDFLKTAQQGDSPTFADPNNLKNTNFEFLALNSNISVNELTNTVLTTLKKFNFIKMLPTVKTLTKGNCFNKCFFNNTFLNPNEIITNTKIASQTIIRNFEIDQIGFLKPFATTNKKIDFVDVELFGGQFYSFAVTTGTNGSWLVRRNNSTNQWTLVGFFGAVNNQLDSCGFELSDQVFMRWGTNIKTACRWEYLLNPDFISPIISFNV